LCSDKYRSYEGKRVEILAGIILGVYWHIVSRRNRIYDEQDWGKIKEDWLKDKFDEE
jgi:hypothetical protein